MGPQAMGPVLLGLHGRWQGAPSISETKAHLPGKLLRTRSKALVARALIHGKGSFEFTQWTRFEVAW